MKLLEAQYIERVPFKRISDFTIEIIFNVIFRWSEGLHGVAGSPGVHFGGKVRVLQYVTIINNYY